MSNISDSKINSNKLSSKKSLKFKENSLKDTLDSARKDRIFKHKEINLLESKRKSVISIQEEEIDILKLDKLVGTLFTKFILFYKYDDVFEIKEEFKNICLNNLNSFSDKLTAYFDIYRIKISRNNSLITDSKEGSYLLRHAKVWIMYIKYFIDKTGIFNFKEICNIFKMALNYDVDEHLLFDFFITLLKNVDENDIEDLNSGSVPAVFINLYKEHKELIFNIIDNESKSNEERLKTVNKLSNNLENNNLSKNIEEQEEKTQDNSDKILNINDSLNIDNNSSPKFENCLSLENSNNVNMDTSNNMKEDDRNNVSCDFTFNDERSILNLDVNFHNNNQIINEIDYNTIFHKINNQSQIEENIHISQENEIMIPNDTDNPFLQYLIKTPEVNLPKINELEEENDKTLVKIISSIKNKEEENEFIIKDKNFSGSGNFAILENLDYNKHKLNHKYVVTPLKKNFSTFKEKLAVSEDLRKIRQSYSEFIYIPYDIDVFNQIINDDKTKKRLSFTKL